MTGQPMMRYEYQVGGSLKLNASSYVSRQADHELYQALLAGEFCCVFNARQMGKSSLRVRMRQQLQLLGRHCAVLDMTSIGSEHLTPSQWYKSLAADLLRSFQLWDKVNLKAWWQEQEGFSPLRRLSLLIDDILLVHLPDQPLYIFVDEVDSALSLGFSVDDFFAFIRYCYNIRADNPVYNRLTWVLLGVTTPSELIRDRTRTPFNIGRAIELHGFQEQDVQPLLVGLNDWVSQPQAVVRELLHWTGGQPFLMQKLCQIVVESGQSAASGKLTLPVGTEAVWIESLVRSHLIHHWETQDQPEHLRTIRDRLLRNELMTVRLLGLYQQILQGDSIPSDDSQEQMELRLSGLVANYQGFLTVKNPIYREVFNATWVADQLARLRPYAQPLKAWVDSQQQDASQLLRGAELQTALLWAKDRMLSDLDYRFLSTSQTQAQQSVERDLLVAQQEREQAEFVLQVFKEAQHMLAQAKGSARQTTQKLRLGRRWVLGTAAIVTGIIIALRLLGVLQGMELSALDRLFQSRPATGLASRITIVTIDEPDLQLVRQFPVPDRVLAQALQTLKRHQPRLIGLDIYRDLPVAPGHTDLLTLFQTTPNLIGADKAVGQRINPPPVLAERGQVGFVDQVLDPDGKVRRALLTIRTSHGLRSSFSLKLALAYLKAEGIEPVVCPNQHIHLGRAQLVPLQSHDGGYVDAITGGYQVLLNFYGAADQFQTLSFADLLADRVSDADIRDRIVLIGYTAESVNDLFQTPYSGDATGAPTQMAGVILHANIIHQLLAAALDGRPLLQGWPEWLEWVWIALWSSLGAALAWRFRTPGRLGIAGGGAIAILVGCAYLAFLQGWWISVVPPILGLVTAAILLQSLANKQAEQIQLYQTLQSLTEGWHRDPTVGHIAMESFKQSESKENQAIIEHFVARNWPIPLHKGPPTYHTNTLSLRTIGLVRWLYRRFARAQRFEPPAAPSQSEPDHPAEPLDHKQ